MFGRSPTTKVAVLFLVVSLIQPCHAFVSPSLLPRYRPTRSPNFPPIGASRWHTCTVRRHTVQLSALPDAVSAASGLVVASVAGTLSEGTILPKNAGILGTLIVSAIFSNLGWVPPAHALYDLCWSLFLPGSLALLLLEKPPTASEGQKDQSSGIGKVGLAFVVSSIASIVGCMLSFFICRASPSLWLSPADAAVAGGCLTASYVGGSINFFATARLVDGRASLLSAMAAADLLVMAIYFAWLATALQNKRLVKWFGNDGSNKYTDSKVELSTTDTESDNEKTSISLKATATVLVSLVAWSMALIANRGEQVLNRIIPGTACGIIALLGTSIQRWAPPCKLWRAMQKAATPLASLAFQIFFAAIGISANLGQALQAGPACLWFAASGLAVHVVGTLVGCRLLLRKQVQLKHVLVASNAAIGGPATAAAYAGQQRTGLTLAATIWGVVGYGIGTNLGLGMCRWFQSCL